MRRQSVNGSGICGTIALLAAVCLVICLESPGALGAADGRVQTNAFHVVELSQFGVPPNAEAAAARPFAVLPRGPQVFHQVPFLAGEPVVLTGMEAARSGQLAPAEVKGIQVGSKARRLHLLHGALSTDRDGVPMAKLVWHYAGGAEESTRLGYGVHARDWVKPHLEKKSRLLDPNSQVAWTENDPNERGNGFRLFQTALENPRPDEVVTSIDLVSLFSRAGPFVVAMSIEAGDSGLPPNRPARSRKILRELRDYSDSTYRQELVVRVFEAQGGGPLTNAVASLTLTDDAQTYYFGEARADGAGVCRLAYPPQQTVAFGVLVRAPSHIPSILSESRTNRKDFSRDFAVQLASGVAVGGVVKNPEGKPIPGVEVLVHRVVKTGAREYTRTDYDAPVTDASGKWSSRSLPPGFEGFSFQLTHPDYRPAFYTMLGYAEPPPIRTTIASPQGVSYRVLPDGSMVAIQPPGAVRTSGPGGGRTPSLLLVTSNALLAGTAEMILQPAILVSGTVLGSDGKPIAGAEVVFQRHSPAYERKHIRTGSDGSFRLTVADPGEGALVVIREGQTPKYQPLNIEHGMAPIQIRLAPPRVLRGRVIDRQQKPVPGAKVRLEQWQGMSDLLHFQTVSDEQGRFSWIGAPPDQVMFSLSKSNYYNMRSSFSGVTDEITLFLNQSPGVSGKVYDAETKKPVESFTIIKGRKYSPNDTQMRWERYDTVRGHNGEYSARISDYYFQPEARLMVEAPGYLPQISRGWQSPDAYTNDFALKRGRGLSGVVQQADGTPVPNATLLLVDKGESGYMDTPGRFRANSSNGDFTRSNAKGQFEFSPKLEADTILAAHEQGYAEFKSDPAKSNAVIVLQPWGRVQGVMRVGDKPAPDQTIRLQNRPERFYEPGYRSSALSLYLRAEPDETGAFVFEKVPPGDRRIYVEYHFHDRNNGETPLSHGLPVAVKPGQTNEIMLGGTGRSVVGRVKVLGGDQSDVDWKRDVHKLTLVIPDDPVLRPMLSSFTNPQDQQKAWADYNRRQREFWQSEAGRLREAAERTYVLLFDTNGNFHIDNVPPGRYQLQINASDPEEEYYRQRSIGNLFQEVVVPDEPSAKVNQPFEIGALELKIQPKIKMGKPAPPFEAKTFEGKPIKLSDFSGRPVLLYFWAAEAISTYDIQMLKELYNSYVRDDKLAILGMNLDAEAVAAAQYAKNQGMVWPHAHLGSWGQTQVPALFGVDGYPVGLLIDAEGKLVARQLRSTALRNAVRNLLAKEPVPVAARP